MRDIPTSGQAAYEAYRKYSNGVSLVSGAPIPEWAELPANIQAAWQAAGQAVESLVNRGLL